MTLVHADTTGYLQLVTPNGHVIAQVLATHAELLAKWMQPGAVRKHVSSTNLVHPQHFTAPVKKHANVQIFATRKRSQRWWSPRTPRPFENLPLIQCKAYVLEAADIDDMVKRGTEARAYGWRAIVDGDLVGERII